MIYECHSCPARGVSVSVHWDWDENRLCVPSGTQGPHRHLTSDGQTQYTTLSTTTITSTICWRCRTLIRTCTSIAILSWHIPGKTTSKINLLHTAIPTHSKCLSQNPISSLFPKLNCGALPDARRRHRISLPDCRANRRKHKKRRSHRPRKRLTSQTPSLTWTNQPRSSRRNDPKQSTAAKTKMLESGVY